MMVSSEVPFHSWKVFLFCACFDVKSKMTLFGWQSRTWLQPVLSVLGMTTKSNGTHHRRNRKCMFLIRPVPEHLEQTQEVCVFAEGHVQCVQVLEWSEADERPTAWVLDQQQRRQAQFPLDEGSC